MDLHFKQLDSGYIHIKGDGPNNWWQGPKWPCVLQESLDLDFAAEASSDFRRAVHSANMHDLLEAEGPHRGDVL